MKTKQLSLFIVASVLFAGGCGGSGSSGNVTLPVGPTAFTPGYIYVGDKNGSSVPNGRVSAFPNLNFTTWKSYHPTGLAAVNADGMAFDLQGRLVFADTVNTDSKVVRIDDMDGLNRVEFGTFGTGVNQFQSIEGLMIDPAGKIYVADLQNQRITRFDDMTGANWITLTSTQVNAIGQPRQIARDSSGRLYIFSINGAITRVNDMTGAGAITLQLNSSNGDGLDNPIGFAIDSQDRLYITDSSHDRIIRVDDMTGANRVDFGFSGSGLGSFHNPVAIAFDGSGRMLISDQGNGRIVRMDDMTGANFKAVGHLGTTDGKFNYVGGIVVR